MCDESEAVVLGTLNVSERLEIINKVVINRKITKKGTK